jgi:hypothetical protein
VKLLLQKKQTKSWYPHCLRLASSAANYILHKTVFPLPEYRPLLHLTVMPIVLLLHADSFPMCNLFLWGKSGRGVKLTTHLHLMPRLIMHGAIPPLHQYVLRRGS